MDKDHEVLLNAFVIAKKRYRVIYNTGILVWEEESSKKAKVTVPITDVLSVILSKHANGRQSLKRSKPPASARSKPHDAHDGSLDSDRIPVLSSSLSSTTTNTLATNSQSENRGSPDELSDRHEHSFYDSIRSASGNYLIIHYATLVCTKTCRWRVKSVALHNTEQRIVDNWYTRLSADLRDQNRPKNLLLFLNPYGGKKNALSLYERYAKPLFRLAEVDINLIITQRAQQIFDIVTSKSIALESYDGLVCCGGDGTVAELFNGLVNRTMTDLGLDVKHPPYLPKPNIPIGVIPAGSTDTVAYCLNGTTDIKTSIIHIILGQHSGLDIAAVYDASTVKEADPTDRSTKPRPQLLKLYASVLSYGYLGDIAYDSEKYRWMGPKRYEYSGFKKFMRNRGYNGEIVVHVDRNGKHDPDDGVRCVEKCSRCYGSVFGLPDGNTGNGSGSGSASQQTSEAIVINGKFLMVNGANISCSCERSPQGFSPFCHVGDGMLDLVIVRHTSFFNNLRLLLTMTSKRKKISDLPFVEIYRTKEFRFTAPQAESVGVSRWNCDGEVMIETNIIVESNCQLVNVFRRGIMAGTGQTAGGRPGEQSTTTSDALPIDDKGSSCFGLCK
ncbi:ceramide kinase [Anopheles cruzii]|uniref:ceramide kinase n=1 Tax=Anopheles cruzii TaxID=68878 RepID=UPI0022EC5F1A|nr:ceramide kinase [Anopheles cruzii]XP_052865485.1 ceramide kinase [Anopheles cruzii]